MKVNPHRDGMVPVVIHELIHVYIHMEFDCLNYIGTQLEEEWVYTWERHLYVYLQQPSRSHLLESWVRAIDRKLKEC